MEKDTRNAIFIILLVAAGIVGAVFGSTIELGFKGDEEWPPDRDEIERGQVIAAPGTIKPHTYAEAQVYVLSKEEGGRHTPFFNGYKPQFYIRTTDVTGTIELPEGVEMVMPGDNVAMKIKLIYPVALEQGLRFAIREGGRTVGAGTFSRIIE